MFLSLKLTFTFSVNLQCCCGAISGAVSGAKNANKQREEQGRKKRKIGHSSSKSGSKNRPIIIETTDGSSSSGNRKHRKKNQIVVTVDDDCGDAEIVEDSLEKLKNGENFKKRKQNCPSLDDNDDYTSTSNSTNSLYKSTSTFTDDSASFIDDTENGAINPVSEIVSSNEEDTGDTETYEDSYSSKSPPTSTTLSVLAEMAEEIGPNSIEESQSTALSLPVQAEDTEVGRSASLKLLGKASTNGMSVSKLMAHMLELQEQMKSCADDKSSPSSLSPSPPTLLTPSLLSKLTALP